jgi:segregation and condensation protein A
MDDIPVEQGGADPSVWEAPPRRPPAPAPGTAPVLSVDGFEGPLDWLLELVRARRIDLAKLSITALVDALPAR